MKKRNSFLAAMFLLSVLFFFSACTSEIKEEIQSQTFEKAYRIQLINADLKPSFVESLSNLHAQGELQKKKDVELLYDEVLDKLVLLGEFEEHINFSEKGLEIQASEVHVGEATYAYLMDKYEKQESELYANDRIEDCPGCMSFYECICMGNLCVWYLRCVPEGQGGPGGGVGGPGGGGGCGFYTCDDNGEIVTYCLPGPVPGGMGGSYPPCPDDVCG